VGLSLVSTAVGFKILLDPSRTIEFPTYLPEPTSYCEIVMMLGSIAYILVQKLYVPGLVTINQSGSRCSPKCKCPTIGPV
jgi:hypothetical protein